MSSGRRENRQVTRLISTPGASVAGADHYELVERRPPRTPRRMRPNFVPLVAFVLVFGPWGLLAWWLL